ncbi:uncharacterized protein LOC142340194 [Convolutriloba macropyga]|uniref:uncharacterized protein LOC142340194 n=1 Tax=Convolutriloba macropyga TaxID=536237 RepID=UPI003F51DE97
MSICFFRPTMIQFAVSLIITFFTISNCAVHNYWPTYLATNNNNNNLNKRMDAVNFAKDAFSSPYTSSYSVAEKRGEDDTEKRPSLSLSLHPGQFRVVNKKLQELPTDHEWLETSSAFSPRHVPAKPWRGYTFWYNH